MGLFDAYYPATVPDISAPDDLSAIANHIAAAQQAQNQAGATHRITDYGPDRGGAVASSSILPISRFADGSIGLDRHAGLIAALAGLPQQAMDAANNYTAARALGDDAGAADAAGAMAGVAGQVGMAGSPFSRPAGSLGMFGVMFGRKAASVVGAEPVQSFVAYHGSPASFDTFDLAHFNTGEGVGSLGHGVNLASKESVARQYRDGLANPDNVPARYKVAGETIHAPAEGEDASGAYLAAQLAHANGHDAAMNSLSRGMLADSPQATEGVQALQRWAGAPVTEKTLGHLYEVGVASDPSHFMDWRAPIASQSGKVRDAVTALGYSPKMTGREVFDAHVAASGGDQVAASQALRDAGVPGVTFLGDRNTSWGDHKNFVVFDPSTLTILRKYGLAGLTAGAGAAGMYDFAPQGGVQAPSV